MNLLLCVALVTGCTSQQPVASAGTTDQRTLARAVGWLWSQQAEDGGWHSQTYGLLKSGQGYTPFILHTLLQVPEEIVPRPPGAVDRGLEFLRRHVNSDGVIGLANPDVLEYPNYSTAYALRCLIAVGASSDAPLIARMQRHLLDQQYRDANGFDRQHPAHGGWGFGAAVTPDNPGHMDLAHTRRVLDALRESRSDDSEAPRRAEHFLRIVQRRPDGGFYFSPIVSAANKGREEPGDPPHFRSYATATCDGLLALLAAGVPRDDERVQSAIAWLERHPQIERPEGIPLDHPEPWSDALHFYHLAVRSEAYAATGWPGDWRERIRRHLAAQQQAGGSFSNTRSHLMKEDDPLLATALAVIALSH